MNLILDIGNTYTKVAVFNKGKFLKKKVTKNGAWLDQALHYVTKHKSITHGIVSNVGGDFNSTLSKLAQHIRLLKLDHNTKLPFDIAYKTPGTLGVDRIALAAATCSQYQKQNVLVIDAGTCVTYDFMDSQNCYLGGAISPGIQMRYKALNNLTANLPLLSRKHPGSIVGNSTASSIHSGVIHGICFEIDGVINEYRTQYDDLTVILTGGDAKFLSKRLKNSIFANSNFLLEGLNNILEFNK